MSVTYTASPTIAGYPGPLRSLPAWAGTFHTSLPSAVPSPIAVPRFPGQTSTFGESAQAPTPCSTSTVQGDQPAGR